MKMSVSPCAGLQAAAERGRFERAQAWSCRPRRRARPRRARPRPRRPCPRRSRTTRCACGGRRDVLVAHRLEGARADMQRQRARAATPRASSASSSASSKCSAAVGAATAPGRRANTRLVAALVVGRRRRADVRRQRHVAVRLQQFERVGRKAQVEQRVVGPGAAQHLGVERVGEAHAAARPSATCSRAAAPAPRCPAARVRPAPRTAPPLAFSPSSRALITRVSLNTSRSPGAKQRRQVASKRWSTGVRARPSSRRDALRSAAGCCAISRVGQFEVEVAESEVSFGHALREPPRLFHAAPVRVGPAHEQRFDRTAAQDAVRDRPGRWTSSACARHRPGAAPAAALRGRDAARRRSPPARRRRAQVEGTVVECRVEPALAPPAGGAAAPTTAASCCCASCTSTRRSRRRWRRARACARAARCAPASSAARWCTRSSARCSRTRRCRPR